jgi:anti-sigma factor RsiW
MSPAPPPIREDDLHAFVDGECDTADEEAILRHLAASPADQVKVVTWRRQNARLRSTFAELAHAPQPSAPASPPQLRVVADANVSAPVLAPPPRPRTRYRGRWFAAALFLSFGLGLSLGTALWLEGLPRAWHSATKPSTRLSSAVDFESARVAAQIAQALTEILPSIEAPRDEGTSTAVQSPSLSAVGLELTSAQVTALQGEPLGCFAYAGDGERFVLCIAKLPSGTTLDIRPMALPKTPVIAWQESTRLYVLAGSVGSDRLVDVAHAIRVALAAAKD